ncbi:MAG: hypothetical protein AAFP19_05590 [Bacteroidota bacterium]
MSTAVSEYTELSYTYGSGLRDRAMILETFALIKDKTRAAEMAKNISDNLNAQRWYGTHSVSYALMALGKYFGNGNGGNESLKFAYQLGNGKKVEANSDLPVMLIDIPEGQAIGQEITVSNRGKGTLFTKVILKGQPVVGDQTEASSHLNMDIRYFTTSGAALDPSSIEQGMDFVVEVKLSNPGTKNNWYPDMALTQIFPSGWEIMNTRMSNVGNLGNANIPTYADIRDDRVYSYFNISSNNSKTYRVQLNAAYQGRFYLPSIDCEAMYDNSIHARRPGQWVEVVGPKAL